MPASGVLARRSGARLAGGHASRAADGICILLAGHGLVLDEGHPGAADRGVDRSFPPRGWVLARASGLDATSSLARAGDGSHRVRSRRRASTPYFAIQRGLKMPGPAGRAVSRRASRAHLGIRARHECGGRNRCNPPRAPILLIAKRDQRITTHVWLVGADVDPTSCHARVLLGRMRGCEAPLDQRQRQMLGPEQDRL